MRTRTRKTTHRHYLSQAGFSLLELTIVMIVASLLVTPIYLAIKQSTNAGVNADRATMIRSGLAEYFRINGKFPCPADITAAEGSANYMTESCGTAITTAGATSGNVLIGAVPVRTLAIFMDCAGDGAANGLTAEIAERFRSQMKNMLGIYRDARGTAGTAADLLNTGADKTSCIEFSNMFTDYDTKYIYAVTESAKDIGTFDPNGGQIRILDVNGNRVTAKDQIFVIVSTGKDRKGARNIDGSTTGIVCGAAGSAADQDNCDNDATFVVGLSSDVPGANYYDDAVDFGIDDLMREDEMWSFEGADADNPDMSILPSVAQNARLILGPRPTSALQTDDKLIVNEGNVRLRAGNLTATLNVNASNNVDATGIVRAKERVESNRFCYSVGSAC